MGGAPSTDEALDVTCVHLLEKAHATSQIIAVIANDELDLLRSFARVQPAVQSGEFVASCWIVELPSNTTLVQSINHV